ncbi:hypothetical protein M23134_06501 [Microscilla marina ATCC 23134]|uniref:Uncharacterized protein n=2 Tax=Microscilla marina TaxID=1027 RepID=A2A0F2_MICM2|nr:hypothetical protein M23134_06501 [Microscilla marina ATCC 23134]
MFSCQKSENVEPQKPTAATQSSRTTQIIEVAPPFLEFDKIKVYNNLDLLLNSKGELVAGRLAEDARVRVAAKKSTEKATFKKGTMIYFDITSKVIGALRGRLDSDAIVTTRGVYGKVVRFLAGTEINFSPERNNLGVTFGVLGASTQLINSDGTVSYYPQGTRVNFDEQGLVKSSTLPW